MKCCMEWTVYQEGHQQNLIFEETFIRVWHNHGLVFSQVHGIIISMTDFIQFLVNSRVSILNKLRGTSHVITITDINDICEVISCSCLWWLTKSQKHNSTKCTWCKSVKPTSLVSDISPLIIKSEWLPAYVIDFWTNVHCILSSTDYTGLHIFWEGSDFMKNMTFVIDIMEKYRLEHWPRADWDLYDMGATNALVVW